MKGFKSSSKVVAQTLGGIALFKDLSIKDRGAIAKRCQGGQFDAGQQIISYKDQTSDVYFIVSGEVRATIFTYTGKKVSFRDIEAGQVFGEWSAC